MFENNRVLSRLLPFGSRTSTALALTMALATTVRLIGIANKSIIADEAASIRFAQLKWPAFLHVISSGESNMALYYLLLRAWIHLGDGPWVTRFLSVIAGVLTNPVIYIFASESFSTRAALYSSLLASVNSFHIAYSQTARSYSFAVLLVTLSSLLFIKLVCTNFSKRSLSVLYVIVSASSLYVHFFAGFVILAQFVCCLSLPVSRTRFLRQTVLMVAIGALCLPILLFIAVHQVGPLEWVQPPTAKAVYHLYTYLAGSGIRSILSLIAVGFALREWRRRYVGDRDTWIFIFLTVWFLLPIVCTLAISQWKPIFSPRFLLICLPPTVLIAGEGLAQICPDWLRKSMVIVFVLSSLLALRSYYRNPGIEDWKGATQFLQQHTSAQDAILFPNEYYFAAFKYNLDHAKSLNFNHTLLLVNDFHQRQFPVQHIWLILCHAPNEDETIAKLKDLHYLQDQSAAFDGIQLLRLSKRADARLIAPPAFLGASRIALLPQRVFAPAQSLVRALRIIPARLAIR